MWRFMPLEKLLERILKHGKSLLGIISLNGACPSCSKKSMGKMMMDSKKPMAAPPKKGMLAGMKRGKG